MWLCRAALTVLVLAALTGCGWRPLYGTDSTGRAATSEMQSIAIQNIPDRIGQILRNDLRDRLTPRGVPRQPLYRLAVEVSTSKVGLAIEPDAEITRSNFRLRASFQLVDLRLRQVVLKGSAFSVGSFNLVKSDFANVVAEQDVERRTARDVSDQIAVRLAVFFNRQRQG
jgi:LPS-assembly lipoprotein